MDVIAWFGGELKAEGRTDHYLKAHGCPFLGVKLRDDKFEVKRRDADYGVVDFAPGVAGRSALWRKFSYVVPANSPATARDGHWIAVDKSRALRKYSLDTSGTIGDATGTFPVRGCTVELTELTAAGRKWWTFGFEAFGPDNELELRETLRHVSALVFSAPSRTSIAAIDSFDYPEWLARL